MKRNIICTSCPNGCEMVVTVENGIVKSVTGNICPKGMAYAKNEMENPKRMLATTVRVKNGVYPLVPVRTKDPIPKALLKPSMKVINRLIVEAPVNEGDVIFPDILQTGVDIIATKTVECR